MVIHHLLVAAVLAQAELLQQLTNNLKEKDMNFFNRAIKNVTRKLSKTILLIITFFVIGNFVIIGLSVAQASESAKTLTRQKMRAVVSYVVDYDKFYRDADQIEDEDERNKFYENYPKITLEDVKNVLKDERVKTANVNTTATAYLGEGLDFVHLNNKNEENNNSGGQSCWIDGDGNEQCETYVEPNAFIKANYFPSMIELEDGDFVVTSGRFYDQSDIDNGNMVVLVTEAFASHNGLSVGDKIELQFNTYSEWYEEMGITEDDMKAEFEVIGIYTHNQAVTPDMPNYDWLSPYENADNMLLMPGTSYYRSMLKIQQRSFDYYAEQNPDEPYYQDPANRPTEENIVSNLYDVTILLNDPLDVDQFVEDYSSQVGEYKKLDANNEEFNKLAKPLDTLSDYATFIIWLVVINAIVIITLVTALTLKTREYEIGVLLSIGASKMKVVAQFFVELAIVALIGFTLSVGSGTIASKQIGASLLENQIESAGLNNEEDDNYNDYFNVWDSDYTTDVSLEDIVSEYQVTVSPVIIAEIYVVGLAIVMISVVIPSIMIMRFNPKKILMNQN
ncbi:MAG: FtsX-like permease family protein [Solobacterium sp.]|nr:FtsX-like permease family protein [Solobacterium sp.]